MFTIDAKIDNSRIREKQLFKVLFSMNSHQVANPEMSLEDARSYVFFSREGGKINVYVGLYFGDTDRRLFYTHSANPFPESAMADMEGDARAFAEDLGAMLDEIDFSRLSNEEKKHWLEEQEIFSGKKKEQENDQAVAVTPSEPVQPAVPAVQPAPLSAAPVAVPVTPQVPPPSPVSVPPVQPMASVPPVAPAAPMVAPLQQSRPSPPPFQPEAEAGPAGSSAQTARPRQAPKPQRKTGSPSDANADGFEAGEESGSPGVQRVEDLLEEAVKAGVVKAPKAQLKKDIRSATGVVSRDKEALARLLASF